MSRKPLLEGQQAQKSQTTDVLTRELADPHTLLSFLPDDLHEGVKRIPERLTNIEEEELTTLLEAEYKYTPSTLLNSLRVRFWQEFDVAFAKKAQMNMIQVYLGICSRTQFHNIIKDKPHQLAFILCEPPEYKTAMEGLEPLQLRVWKNILNIPMKENGKRQDPKILELQHKVALAIDLRNKGGYLNRSETKNLTMLHQKSEHTHTTHNIDSKVIDTSKMTAIEYEEHVQSEIAMLEADARKQLPPPAPKFAEAIDTEYTDVKEHGDK